ncbi:hypothetical protein EB796_024262 [Bugula neritina]|uniref:Uncharacterized protein n=1 Tax=Bugula neritina TaxID=10212 RepID=A0A7J7IV60_BUGNE|nr:hypothetical protein EB796_024262 [Bugula neritina]
MVFKFCFSCWFLRSAILYISNCEIYSYRGSSYLCSVKHLKKELSSACHSRASPACHRHVSPACHRRVSALPATDVCHLQQMGGVSYQNKEGSDSWIKETKEDILKLLCDLVISRIRLRHLSESTVYEEDSSKLAAW